MYYGMNVCFLLPVASLSADSDDRLWDLACLCSEEALDLRLGAIKKREKEQVRIALQTKRGRRAGNLACMSHLNDSLSDL